jgi:hypothetical protein
MVNGTHGVWVRPDMALSDLDRFLKTTTVSLVILPEGSQSLASLEIDPRVHKLLRQVVGQGGQIATSPEGLRILRAAAVWIDKSEDINDDLESPVLLRDLTKSPEAFAQELIRLLLEPPTR